MKIVLQRVSKSVVHIEGELKGEIGKGFLLLLGITTTDSEKDIDWLVKKICQLRIFNDKSNKMNLSIQDVSGDILLVSQFTLYANIKKGNRPSYIKAARPEIAIPLYELFIKKLETALEKPIQTGEFGADMQIALINDGPVTIVMDSLKK
jgi:D-tyrosyl-tRNA(Tyr) deacylase